MVEESTDPQKPEYAELESSSELNPTFGEVLELLEGLAVGESYEIIRNKSDDEGLYLLEINFDTDTGKTEYAYLRKGEHEFGGSTTVTNISVAYYDHDGFPTGGTTILQFENGKWM